MLGVALLLPIGTVVLVSYYFTRMSPLSTNPQPVNHWAYSVIAIAGGLSAMMATLLSLFASATYRARVRFENELRSLQRYLNHDVARERMRLMRNLDLVSAAQQVSMAIKQEVDFKRILSVVLEQIEHFAHSDSVSVFTQTDHGDIIARAERRDGVDRFDPEITFDNIDTTLVTEAILSGQMLRSYDEDTGEFVLAVYFATPEGVRGVVRINRNVKDDTDFESEAEAYENAVSHLVRMVSLGLKTANMWDRAIKDEKTGLYNANHYADQIRRAVAGARRTGSPLSLVMLDIDKFKYINDNYGHAAGDKVLAEVSALLMREAREADTTFRYGGEELCVICSGTTQDEAGQAAERLRQAIAQTEFRDNKGTILPISASLGVAEFNPRIMRDSEDLKEMCDRALYVAKENGRNVVVCFQADDKFEILERAGDRDKEVKLRLGLLGDNSLIEPKKKKSRKAKQETDAEQSASASAQLGESIDRLASGLAEAVGQDSERARVVDSVVREATEFLAKNLSARLGQPEPEPRKPKRKRKAATKKPTKAKKKPAAKKTAPKKPAKRKAAKKPDPIPEPIDIEAEEEAKLKAESDRLDYLTDDEGEQLIDGRAPSKRLRNAQKTA